jgi:hypothetical protein
MGCWKIKVNENQCLALGDVFHFTVSSALFMFSMVKKLDKRENDDDDFESVDMEVPEDFLYQKVNFSLIKVAE